MPGEPRGQSPSPQSPVPSPQEEAEELPTAQPEEGEPSGADDESAEAEIEQATERPDEAGERDDEEDDDPLAAAQRERDRYLELAQRTQADFENYRKRAAKEAAVASERAKGGLVRELLPVVDNLERALASAGEGEQHLAEGVRLVHSELVGVLERNGVEPFDPAGEQFDPELHEALSTRSEEGADAGVVLDTVEKGYRAGGTVLRPARVVVSA